MRQALETTVELCTWLANNPGKVKAEWPGWTAENHSISRCPCCEHATKTLGHIPRCFRVTAETRKDLEACPMKTAFPQGCKAYDSPYLRWDIAVGIVRNAGPEKTAVETELELQCANSMRELARHAQAILERL